MLLPGVLTGQPRIGFAEVTLGTGGEYYSWGRLGGNRRFVKTARLNFPVMESCPVEKLSNFL
jgi:hypothetical protein